MSDVSRDRPTLIVVESVRCLECETVYAKPTGGGTAQENPGCPKCGYVGWISTSVAVRGRARRRSDEDRLPHRHARSG